MDFKNPEILASAFNYRELLIKETLLIQEQQPEIDVDNFSTPLYLFNAWISCRIVGLCSVPVFMHVACIAVGAGVDVSCWLLSLKMLNGFLRPSFAVLCEWSFAAGLDLFTWIANLCRSCFSTFCIPVGPAFTVSEFDRVDGLGFAFDVFCVTLLFLASQSFAFELLALPRVALLFFDWRWIKINPKHLFKFLNF